MSPVSERRHAGPAVDRRRLLATVGVASAAVVVGLPGTASADLGAPQSWRNLFVLDRDPLFMNVGTVGSPPREVLRVLEDEQRLVARQALSNYHGTFDDVRGQIA